MRTSLPLALAALPILTHAALAQEVLWNKSLPESFGSAACQVDDRNGDGKADFAVTTMTGIDIRSSANGSVIASLAGHASNAEAHLEPAGDVNGDGTLDLLFAPTTYGSEAKILSGSTGAVLHQLTLSVSAFATPSFAAVGDWNNDGSDDFAVSSNLDHSLTIYSGLTGAPLLATSLPLNSGFLLRAAGDMNQDGKVDLITADFNDFHVLSGLTGATLLTVPLPPQAFAGTFPVFPEVLGGHDIDGDGIPDIIIGNRFSSVGGTNAGEVRIHSGTNGQLIRRILGSPCDGLGSRLSAGNFDRDGCADIVVGQLNDIGLPNHVRVYSGCTGEQLLTTQLLFTGVERGFLTEDIDADGLDDLIVLSVGFYSGFPPLAAAVRNPSTPLKAKKVRRKGVPVTGRKR